jgi:hypothetical protein
MIVDPIVDDALDAVDTENDSPGLGDGSWQFV